MSWTNNHRNETGINAMKLLTSKDLVTSAERERLCSVCSHTNVFCPYCNKGTANVLSGWKGNIFVLKYSCPYCIFTGQYEEPYRELSQWELAQFQREAERKALHSFYAFVSTGERRDAIKLLSKDGYVVINRLLNTQKPKLKLVWDADKPEGGDSTNEKSEESSKSKSQGEESEESNESA